MECVNCRLHADVKARAVLCEVRANHTGQPLNDSTQVFAIHLMQFDCNRDVKHASTPLRSIREQTTAQHASKGDN